MRYLPLFLSALAGISVAQDRFQTKAVPSPVETSTQSEKRNDAKLYADLCQDKGQTVQSWKKNHMDDYLEKIGRRMHGTESFRHAILANTSAVNKFDCHIDGVCNLQSTGQGCNTLTENNPKNWFALNAIVHFHEFIKEVVIKEIDRAAEDAQWMSDFLTVHFSSHNFELAAATWKNSVASGVLGATASVLGLAALAFKSVAIPLSATGTLEFMASSSLTVFTGYLGSLVTKTVGVIQNELNEGAKMKQYMGITIDALRQTVVSFGDVAINGIAYNPPDTYEGFVNNKTGLVQLLKGGAFAESVVDKGLSMQIRNETLKQLYAVAVNNMWKQENVYLVNVTDTYKDMIVSRRLDKLDPPKKDMVKIKIDKYTYFLVKYTSGVAPDEEYESPPGVDQLGTLGLDLKDIVLASGWAQEKGGFNWDPTPEEFKGGYDKAGGIFMNIPICNMQQLTKYGPNYNLFKGFKHVCYSTGGGADDPEELECEFKRLINKECVDQIQTFTNGTKQSWPIDLFDKNWKG
ncbi:hypothetical protein N7492_007773 [Penicillium capsulatum]|uniref:Uncharacterized protein n=1 Tax=Penicillium capsulatum TaxID=69766 RepID=A0A9W9I2W6_9EURO|nr:hypothetical protein N7492_007773 [Penicillium capsulatum]KAJ6117605.1 hypothetical protein N7512_007330 [Penicillium capsulatum]